MCSCTESNLSGVYFYASAWNIFAREMTFLGFDKDNFTINSGMDGEIAAHKGAWASNFGCASLANENFTSFDVLATKTLDAEPLTGIIV